MRLGDQHLDMEYAQLRERCADVGVTTAVPFTDDSSVDHDALEMNLASLVEAGIQLFFPAGNTGEHYALTIAERRAVVKTHVEMLPAEATIIAGVSGGHHSVITTARDYATLGVDGVLIMHPMFPYCHERGLSRYYHRIADETELGLVIYRRDSTVSRDVIVDIAERENVIGVKFAQNDLTAFGRVVADAPDAVTWLTGNAERYAVAFAQEGATGFTTGLGNLLPSVPLALFEAIEADEWDRARSLRDRIRPFEELRTESGEGNSLPHANNVPVVKHGMDYTGLTGGRLRPPLVQLSTADERRLETIVDDLATIED